MKKSILIADSGGTSTSWCFISQNGEKHFFEGISYHPLHWGDEFIEKEKVFWQKHNEYSNVDLHFFGAGCLAENNAQRMKLILLQLGFDNVTVKSDLHASALSLYGNKKGVFAILGTGSVAGYVENGEISQMKGGLGYILGDEGSAFTFGRLLVRFLLDRKLSDELSKELFSLLGDKSVILQQVYGQNGRNYLANLAQQCSEIISDEIQFIHELNISNFLNSLESIREIKKGISFSGSYAFYQRHLIKEILIEKQIPLLNVIQNPIEALSDYFIKTAD